MLMCSKTRDDSTIVMAENTYETIGKRQHIQSLYKRDISKENRTTFSLHHLIEFSIIQQSARLYFEEQNHKQVLTLRLNKSQTDPYRGSKLHLQ